jgi:hypothetical protein
MSNAHSDGPPGRVNAYRGLHPVEKERHWCFVHADRIDAGEPLFGMAPGPNVVELVPSVPLYLRQGPKIDRRAHFGDWLFWISQRGLFRLTRKAAVWLRPSPADAELLPAEIIVRVWLPGPDPRALAAQDGEPPRQAAPLPVTGEASDFIPFDRDPNATGGRRRYVPVQRGRGARS